MLWRNNSLLGKFIGYEENKVSSIQSQVAKIFFNLIEKIIFKMYLRILGHLANIYFTVMLGVIILNVIMLSVIMP